MTLGKLALIVFVGGIAMVGIGLFGVIGEAGVELHQKTTLGNVMLGIMVVGVFAVPAGAILGLVRAIRGPRPEREDRP